MKNANYRKHNDGSHSSSTYHKKDGTPVRSRLDRELDPYRSAYVGNRYNSFGELDPVDDFGNRIKDRD